VRLFTSQSFSGFTFTLFLYSRSLVSAGVHVQLNFFAMSPQGSPTPSATSTDTKHDVLTNHVVDIPTSSAQSQSAYDRRLLLKLDFRIIPILYCLLVIMLIDRANIGNVRIEGILEDLQMKGNDYNVAILVYTVPFMLFELPSSLALRSFRPAVWISAIMFGWGE